MLLTVLQAVGLLVVSIVALTVVAGIVTGVIDVVRALRGSEDAGEPSVFSPSEEGPRQVTTTLALLVRFDEGEGVFHPSVQLRTHIEARLAGSIRLELVDGEERVRLALKRQLPGDTLNRELPLPAFAPPPGASVEAVLGWHWDLVLEIGDNEPIRSRQHPAQAGDLNSEGELSGEPVGGLV